MMTTLSGNAGILDLERGCTASNLSKLPSVAFLRTSTYRT